MTPFPLLVLFLQVSSAEGRKSATFTLYTKPKVSWQTAVDWCHGQGQELLRVASENEHDFLTNTGQPSALWHKKINGDVWSSLYDPDPGTPGEGYQWQLLHQCQPLDPKEDFTKWIINEPMNGKVNLCMQLHWDNKQGLGWRTENCSVTTKFICRSGEGSCKPFKLMAKALSTSVASWRLYNDSATEESCQGTCAQEEFCYAAEWNNASSGSCKLYTGDHHFSIGNYCISLNSTLYLFNDCFKAKLNETIFNIPTKQFNPQCARVSASPATMTTTTTTPTNITLTTTQAVTTVTETPTSSKAATTTSTTTPTTTTTSTTTPTTTTSTTTPTTTTSTTTPTTTTTSTTTPTTTTTSTTTPTPSTTSTTTPTTTTSTTTPTTTTSTTTPTPTTIPTITTPTTTTSTPTTKTTTTTPVQRQLPVTTAKMVAAFQNEPSSPRVTSGAGTVANSHDSTAIATTTAPPTGQNEPSSPRGTSGAGTVANSHESTAIATTTAPPSGGTTTPTSRMLCPCSCTAVRPSLTADQQAVMSRLMKSLVTNRTNTSAHRRKLTSAPDTRKSAHMMGCVGLVVLVGVFGVVVVMDLTALCCGAHWRAGGNKAQVDKSD